MPNTRATGEVRSREHACCVGVYWRFMPATLSANAVDAETCKWRRGASSHRSLCEWRAPDGLLWKDKLEIALPFFRGLS